MNEMTRPNGTQHTSWQSAASHDHLHSLDLLSTPAERLVVQHVVRQFCNKLKWSGMWA